MAFGQHLQHRKIGSKTFILKGTWGQSNIFCSKWPFFIIRQNRINKKFQKFTFKSQLAYICMFIRVYYVTYVEIQFIHSKLCNFISSWKMVKNTIKLYRMFLLRKTNKKFQNKPGVKCFVHSWVWRHLRWIQNFVTSWNLNKTPQRFLKNFFSIKLTKIYPR